MTAVSDQVTEKIGPYELIARLAQGGMGTVHLAHMAGPAGVSKVAVVKELKDDLLGSARFARLFLDEARLAMRLTHPNVVHTYGAGEHDGRLYMAMEFLDGQPWGLVRQRLRENHSLPLHVQLRVLSESLAGLHYAHELSGFDGAPLNVVHCDVSPQNIFVTYDGQVKVVDFGVARAAHGEARQDSALFLGKAAYCSPEQARGELLDRRADVYAVGVMLWEAIAGRRFAVGDSASEMLRGRAQGVGASIREAAPNTPAPLIQICERALAVEPKERYKTALEFRSDLEHYISQSGKVIDAVQLGRMVTNAFELERTRVHGLLRQAVDGGDLSGVSEVGRKLHSEHPAERTLEADLSHLASVTRGGDDNPAAAVLRASLISQAQVRQPLLATPKVPPPMMARVTVAPKGKGNKVTSWVGVAGLVCGALGLAAHWLPLGDGGGQSSDPSAVQSTGASPSPAHSEAAPSQAGLTPQLVPPAGTESPSPTPEPVEALAEAAMAMVRVKVETRPAAAQVFVDDQLVGQAPLELSRPADGQAHRLKVTAEGYESAERVVSWVDDILLAVDLTEKKAVGVKRRTVSRARVTPKPKTSEVSAEPVAASGSASAESPEKATPAPAAAPRDFSELQIYDEDPYQ